MKLKIKKITKFLGLFFIIGGVAVLLYLFSPLLSYKLSFHKIPLLRNLIPETFFEKKTSAKEGNWLSIPKIGVFIPVLEGFGPDELEKGAWLMPEGAKPGEKGNVVLAAHRFQFLPPNERSFYLLDQLTKGDAVTIFFGGNKKEYRVSETREVLPENKEVLEKGTKEKVTLITCAPLFSTEKRLVVTILPLDAVQSSESKEEKEKPAVEVKEEIEKNYPIFKVAETEVSYLNVREDVGIKAKKVGVLKPDDEVWELERKQDQDGFEWSRVRNWDEKNNNNDNHAAVTLKIEGFVMSKYLEVMEK